MQQIVLASRTQPSVDGAINQRNGYHRSARSSSLGGISRSEIRRMRDTLRDRLGNPRHFVGSRRSFRYEQQRLMNVFADGLQWYGRLPVAVIVAVDALDPAVTSTAMYVVVFGEDVVPDENAGGLVDRLAGREHRLHRAVLVLRRPGRAHAVGIVSEGVVRDGDVLGVPPLIAVASQPLGRAAAWCTWSSHPWSRNSAWRSGRGRPRRRCPGTCCP